MTIETIEVEMANGSTADDLEITLRGKAAEIVKVLVNGMPREGLIEIHAALDAEIKKRAKNPDADSA